MRRRWLAAVVLTAACGREDPAARVDQAILRTSVEADEAVALELDEADREVTKGHGKEALAILDGRAAPHAAENASHARSLVARSVWAGPLVSELQTLTADRVAAIAGYEEAIRSDDLERVVASMEQQKDLERRAAEIGAHVRAGPAGGGC